MSYLISPDQMNHDAYVCKVNQPEGFVEAEPGEKITRGLVSKC